MTPQFRTSKPSDFPSMAIAPEGLGVPVAGPIDGSFHMVGNLGLAFILSIHSTILLI
jgi:hypothetical protein